MINYNSPPSFCLASVPLPPNSSRCTSFHSKLWPKYCHGATNAAETLRGIRETWERKILSGLDWFHLAALVDKAPRKDNDNKSNAFKIDFDLFRLLEALEDYAAICFVSPDFYPELLAAFGGKPSRDVATSRNVSHRIVCLHSAFLIKFPGDTPSGPHRVQWGFSGSQGLYLFDLTTMAIERLTQLEVLEAVTNICRQMRILCKCQEPEEEFENQHQQLQLQLQFMRMLIKLTPNGYI